VSVRTSCGQLTLGDKELSKTTVPHPVFANTGNIFQIFGITKSMPETLAFVNIVFLFIVLLIY